MRLDHHFFFFRPFADAAVFRMKARVGRKSLTRRFDEYFECQVLSRLSVSGGITGGATPDPIPNSEVKLSRANGTARSFVWESRTPLELI